MIRNGIPVLTACGLITVAVMLSSHSAETTAAPARAVEKCRCGQPDCVHCQPVRPRKQHRLRRKCPKCRTDVCHLEAECANEERVCFDVDQKIICVPPISLPWRRCPDPCVGDCESRCSKRCGKTKVVKVLQVRLYECPTCRYHWKLFEPELVQPPAGPERPGFGPELQPAVEPIQDVQRPGFEPDELYDPAGSDIPAAPQDDG